jgi:hypothetical protein
MVRKSGAFCLIFLLIGTLAWATNYSMRYNPQTGRGDWVVADSSLYTPSSLASTFLMISSASSTYVPYTGATTDVNLGIHTITTEGVIPSDAGSAYLGSVDNGFNYANINWLDAGSVYATYLSGILDLSYINVNNDLDLGVYAIKAGAGLTLGVDAATNTAGTVKLWSAGANNYSTIISAGTQTADATYTLPTAQATQDSMVLSSTTGGVLSWKKIDDTSVTFPVLSPSGAGNSPLWRVPYALTINKVHILCIGGTSINGMVDTYDINGSAQTAVDTDKLATAGAATDDTLSPTVSVNAGQYIGCHITTVNGSPTKVLFTADFTRK